CPDTLKTLNNLLQPLC
ncbi:hypothetical protein QE152_g39129, partial [Popillia japonica]